MMLQPCDNDFVVFLNVAASPALRNQVALVGAVESATNASYKTVSSSAGEFAFASLPLGNYNITVKADKFTTTKVDKVPVTAGVVYSFPVKLSVASTAETVEVTADSLTLDTQTDTQAKVLSEEAVQNLPNNGRDYTQLIG